MAINGVDQRVDGSRVCVWVFGALVMALAACGGNVPDDGLSIPVRRALAVQDRLEADGAPATSGAEDVRALFRWFADLRVDDRRAAVADSVWQHWEADPQSFLWLDLARYRARELDDPARLAAGVERAAGPDSTRPASLYTRAIYQWRGTDEDRRLLQSAEVQADALDPMQRAWFVMTLATLAAGEGADSLAVVRLVDNLDAAWREGGRPLAAVYWRRISIRSRNADRFDDALAAAERAVILARHDADPTLEILCRRELAAVHEVRGEYDAAAMVWQSCEERSLARGDLRAAQRSAKLAARAYSEVGDSQLALTAYRRSRNLALAIPDTGMAIVANLLISSTHRYAGEIDSAWVWIENAARLDTVGADQGYAGHVATQRARQFLQLGDFDRVDSLRTATADIVPPLGQVQIVFDTIESGLDSGRPDVVYEYLAEAQALEPNFRRAGGYNPYSDLAYLRARFLARQGEFARADQEMATAAELLAESNVLPARYDHAQNLGEIAELAGDLPTAANHYMAALARADSLGDPNLANRSRVRLGGVLVQQRRFDEARVLFAQSVGAPEYWTRLASMLLLGETEVAAGRYRRALEQLAAASALLRRDAPRDLKARLYLAEARAQAALGHAGEARSALQRIELAGAVETNREAAETIRAFHRSLSRELAEAWCGLLYDQPDQAGREGPALEALLMAEASRWRVDSAEPPPSVETASQPLTPGMVVAGFFVGEERCFAWSGSAEGWQMRELPSRNELLARVNAVETDMERPERPVNWNDARALADVLLAPVLERWDGSRPLLVLAPAELSGLPWAALPASNGELVIDRGPVVLGPAYAWLDRSLVAESTPDGALLAVGVDAAPGAERLRQSAAEVRDIAATWPGGDVVLLTGEQARWEHLRSLDLSRYAVIHLASHTRISAGQGGFASLRLVGDDEARPLTLPDVRRLDLNADLVFLSCCEGARPGSAAGTGLDSFTRAFLLAGAGSVVAATRPVEDATARRFALAFYRHWLGGTSRAASLQAAQLEVRDGDQSRRHPFYWAHYQVHTAGSAEP